MISIGNIFKGAELRDSDIARTLSAAANVIADIRGPIQLGASPLLNAMFIVPGSTGNPGFSGFRLGQYSKKNKLVAVQIAVPSEKVNGGDPAGFVVEALRRASVIAEELFRKKGDVYNLEKAEAAIQIVEQHFNQDAVKH